MTFTVLLPYPPSQHRLWGQNPATRKKYRTQDYEAWLADADHAALTQVGRLPRFGPSPVTLVATVYKGAGFRINGDADNRLKAPIDWLVSRQILEDDTWAHIPDKRIYLDTDLKFPRAMMKISLARCE